MAVLTRIDGIPLFSSVEIAEFWGKQFGLKGHHTHEFRGVTGYMAGENHDQIMKATSDGISPRESQQTQVTAPRSSRARAETQQQIIPIPRPTPSPTTQQETTPDVPPPTSGDGY